ncbi:MAG: hypothetical protein IID44_12790 [Planctomycetes bacterium]|nr:hypothetical protein [Planctomycetota bacterium]
MPEAPSPFATRRCNDKWQVMLRRDSGEGDYLGCADESDAQAISQAPVLERRFDMGERTAIADALGRTAKAMRRTKMKDFTVRHFDQLAADAKDASS